MPKAPPVVSNYPRDGQVLTIAPSYAKATIQVCDELGRLAICSFIATLFVNWLFRAPLQTWQMGIIGLFLASMWSGFCYFGCKQILEYSTLAEWPTWRKVVACFMLFTSFYVFPGLLFLLTIRGWVANDLAAKGIHRPWSRGTRLALEQMGGADGE